MNKNIAGVGEVKLPSTPKEKIQNYWYHYKWHTLVALLLVVTILVCSLQLCTKESYDIYVLYAGSKNIGRTSTDGDVAEIVTIISSLKRVSNDFDGDGNINVNFTNYYYLSSDEANDADDVNDALLASDKKALSSVLEHSEYYLCFISPTVYETYHKVGDNELFVMIDEYKESHPELEYYNDSAIYLSSTPLAKLPGFSNLPVDTLICIRRPSVLGAKSDAHLKLLSNAKETLSNVLNLKIG